jgi:hypothetical protein
MNMQRSGADFDFADLICSEAGRGICKPDA